MFEQKVEVAMTSLGIENDRLHPAVQRLALELVARGRQVSNHPYTTPIPPLYRPYTAPHHPPSPSLPQGISQEMRELADTKFYVPMKGFAQSFSLSVGW